MSDLQFKANLRRYSLRICMAWVLSLAAGCSLIEQRSDEDIVLERAQSHLTALRAADYQTALTYTTPAFRESARARRYAATYSAAPTWKNAEIYSVECGEEVSEGVCKVRTRIYPFVPPHIKANIQGLPVSVTVDWIYTDRNWYRYER